MIQTREYTEGYITVGDIARDMIQRGEIAREMIQIFDIWKDLIQKGGYKEPCDTERGSIGI